MRGISQLLFAAKIKRFAVYGFLLIPVTQLILIKLQEISFFALLSVTNSYPLQY